ncbi:MAG: hypothetical protein KA444_04770 [Bacteroidia bacterium]|nr:hypothetical protein [Bacteroidia bacterium]
MDIQLLTVILIFCAALFYAVRKLYLKIRKKSKAGCDACGPVSPASHKN